MGKPFYLVTSPSTGSACEALSFALKYHDLGIVYGENTAGAGHASTRGLTKIGFGLSAFIPNSKPEHPKHSDGFEKIGVTPDIQSTALLAVDRAYQLILSQLSMNSKNVAPLNNEIIKVTNKINRALIKQFKEARAYSQLVGRYSEKTQIVLQQGILKLRTSTGRQFQLTAVESDLFDIAFGRGRQVRVERDNSGNIKGVSLSPSPKQKEWQFRGKI